MLARCKLRHEADDFWVAKVPRQNWCSTQFGRLKSEAVGSLAFGRALGRLLSVKPPTYPPGYKLALDFY
jgi:hypothetical protein